jgi:hypothetical protein
MNISDLEQGLSSLQSTRMPLPVPTDVEITPEWIRQVQCHASIHSAQEETTNHCAARGYNLYDFRSIIYRTQLLTFP